MYSNGKFINESEFQDHQGKNQMEQYDYDPDSIEMTAQKTNSELFYQRTVLTHQQPYKFLSQIGGKSAQIQQFVKNKKQQQLEQKELQKEITKKQQQIQTAQDTLN